MAATLSGGRGAGAGAPVEITIDHDDIDVTTDVVVKPGTYHVEDKNGDGVLRIRSNHVTVRLDGVTLIGAPEGREQDAFEGVGVSIDGHAGVTIEGGTSGAIEGFRVGVRGVSARKLALRGIHARRTKAMRLHSTPEREDESDWLWPHENDQGQWERNYGGGISLTGCEDAEVSGCSAHGGQNGLLLTRCDAASVFDCDFSFNSGWGIAMYRSSRCEIAHDRCDWCVRGYSHGVYARGQDSAGILVFEQCSENVFAFDSATHSGDGFFLYAGNETLKKTGKGGCNRNKVIRNDFSHAVANGIEATFSEGNEFTGNRLDDCDHAVWAGYSHKTMIRSNTAERCANGISIEHGHENRIAGNALTDCRIGVHLWSDPNPELTGGVYGKAQDTSSSMNLVTGNWIIGGDVAVRLGSDTDTRVEANRIVGADVALEALGKTSGLAFQGNAIYGREAPGTGMLAIVRCDTEKPLALGPNWWGPTALGAPAPGLLGRQGVTLPPPLPKEPSIPRPEAGLAPLEVRGSLDAFLPPNAPRGRRYIFVDEWGPVDPRAPNVFPSRQSASGTANLHVLGASLPFTVEKLTDGFVADPSSGTTPAAVKIRRTNAAATPSLAPFEATVQVGDRTLKASGSILTAQWKVRFFEWKKDPREDAAAWKALIAGPALDTLDLDGLDFFWGARAPTPKVPADHFGTVAETTLTLPPGPYRIRTVSDDGIRVFLDGKLLFEDWTHHAPKEDTFPVAMTAGAHAIRVEHFEIDGWAVLRLSVEPVTEHR